MSIELGSRAEAELAVERLLDHMHNWLLQQPEVVLIWAQPRHVRKDVAAAIAHLVTTIPARDPENVEMSRKMRRQVIRALEKEDRDYWRGVKI